MTTVPAHSDKYDDMELTMLQFAVDDGLTYEEACEQYDALQSLRTGIDTSRIEASMKRFFEHLVAYNS